MSNLHSNQVNQVTVPLKGQSTFVRITLGSLHQAAASCAAVIKVNPYQMLLITEIAASDMRSKCTERLNQRMIEHLELLYACQRTKFSEDLV